MNSPLNPEFDPERFDYAFDINYLTTHVSISAEADFVKPGIEGTGDFPREYGENSFNIGITNNYDREKTYTLKINRQLNPNCRLQSLNTLPYVIKVYYSLNTYDYTLNVDKTVDRININAVPIFPAVLSGQAGEQKLNHGNNVFTLTVTAQDGNISSYTLTVWRDTLDTDATLSGLAVNPGAYLYPPFNPEITSYITEVENNIEEVIIDAKLRTSMAKFVNTYYDLPGTCPVKAGENHFNFFIFAENSHYYKVYSLTVTRKDNMTGMQNTNSPFSRWLKPTADGGIGINSPVAERVNIYYITGRLLDSFDKPADAFILSRLRAFAPADCKGQFRLGREINS